MSDPGKRFAADLELKYVVKWKNLESGRRIPDTMEYKGMVRKNLIPFCSPCGVVIGTGTCNTCVVADVIES